MPEIGYLELFLDRRGVLAPEDRRALSAIRSERAVFEDGAIIVGAGPAPDRSCLLIRGMAMRAHPRPKGRRIVSAMAAIIYFRAGSPRLLAIRPSSMPSWQRHPVRKYS